MRFVYCAACISYILDDWSGVNVELMIDFILNSIVSSDVNLCFFKQQIMSLVIKPLE